MEICAQRSPSSERRTADQWGQHDRLVEVSHAGRVQPAARDLVQIRRRPPSVRTPTPLGWPRAPRGRRRRRVRARSPWHCSTSSTALPAPGELAAVLIAMTRFSMMCTRVASTIGGPIGRGAVASAWPFVSRGCACPCQECGARVRHVAEESLPQTPPRLSKDVREADYHFCAHQCLPSGSPTDPRESRSAPTQP